MMTPPVNPDGLPHVATGAAAIGLSQAVWGTAPTPEPNPALLDLRMAHGRLGIVSGLYLALRAKHPPTAMHSLRVALSCSKWAAARKMPDDERDILEVSALLHDIGKLGIPDRVLQKTSQLIGEEQALMEMHLQVGIELLRGSGASTPVLDAVKGCRTWYRAPGALADQAPAPTASRMISIVDAFDAMTSEQVFRKALSRERAIEELFECAGTQFDPVLVKEFAMLVTQPAPQLEALIVRRWLNELKECITPGFGNLQSGLASGTTQTMVDTLYHHQLLDATSDAVVYVDCGGSVLTWNRAAERMTGHSSSSVLHRQWTTAVMGLHDEGRPLADENCPLREVNHSHSQSNRRLEVHHRDGRVFKINLHTLPVLNVRREFCGAIFLLRDASAQASLEERVQSLHERATRDPLTGVHNRAELDKQLGEFVIRNMEQGCCCSLIICDIDHFKRINDTYGHQAGDEALVVFARVLSECARDTDLVARYGGEEFVVICAECDNTAATSRAEEIRRAIENRAIASLRGNTMTASFGVTEIQPGDTDESFLARADRALLLAKETGRNRVVQLGAGQIELTESVEQQGWFQWFRKRSKGSTIVEREFLTPVPADVAVEKLSGFINDHKANILSIEKDQATLRIDARNDNRLRRQGDRLVDMIVQIKWQQVTVEGRHGINQTKTWLKINVSTNNTRDRRLASLLDQANQVMRSVVAYLGAQELDEKGRKSIISADFAKPSSDRD